MEKKNIIEEFKHLPKETKLYSPMYGDLWLAEVNEEYNAVLCYTRKLSKNCVRSTDEDTVTFYGDGTTGLPNFNISKECMLFLPEEETIPTFSFSDALIELKGGNNVARLGWNGNGMFIYYVSEGRYPVKMEAAMDIADDEGFVCYGAYIAMKTAQGNVVPWVASQTDILSEDWIIV